jgi:hypothetical protein
MPEILDHVEKTVADKYRKEIDQEENVWRTLPFFVAALSLEVAELTQVAMRTAAGIATLTSLLAILLLGAVTGLPMSYRLASHKKGIRMSHPPRDTLEERDTSHAIQTRAKPEMPVAPKMRVVGKGLFTLRESSETSDQAERENNERHAHRAG